METVELPRGRLTRVGYLEVPVPAALLGLSADEVAAIPWSMPTWARETQPLLGAAAWVFDTGERRLVFDPLQTLDVLLRPDRDAERTNQEAVARLFADAGYPVESIDLVVMSHIDGVGMVARRDDDGNWSPFFPRARVLLSDLELRGFLETGAAADDAPPDLTRAAWTALVDAGCIDTFADGETIVPGVLADVSGGHGPGHTVMHFQRDEAVELSLIGHLAVSPIHLATGECAALNEDPAAAWRLLHENAADGRLIAGALWPTPGYGRWRDGALRAGR
jgi:hypothetical protein